MRASKGENGSASTRVPRNRGQGPWMTGHSLHLQSGLTRPARWHGRLCRPSCTCTGRRLTSCGGPASPYLNRANAPHGGPGRCGTGHPSVSDDRSDRLENPKTGPLQRSRCQCRDGGRAHDEPPQQKGEARHSRHHRPGEAIAEIGLAHWLVVASRGPRRPHGQGLDEGVWCEDVSGAPRRLAHRHLLLLRFRFQGFPNSRRTPRHERPPQTR